MQRARSERRRTSLNVGWLPAATFATLKDPSTGPSPSPSHGILRSLRSLVLHALILVALGSSALGQVHYHPNGQPWRQKARQGPDAEVPGWFYNLGISGVRVELDPEAPTDLLVRHVFSGTPADGKVRVGDRIQGAGGRDFEEPHQNGYGMDVFGPKGPILDFALALEACQAKAFKGKRGTLALKLQRGSEQLEMKLKIGTRYGSYSDTYPLGCAKSDKILEELYGFLLAQQGEDGSWGNPVHNTFAPLALLSSGNKKHLRAVERNVRMHARTTHAKDESSLINWRYMAAGLVMGEYYLASGEEWVLPELQEVYAFLLSSQYIDMAQVNPRVKETHPHALPKGPMDSYGGWGHNPGFEGYGPISMLTGQGALVFSILARCGVEVDRERHDAAYEFLARGTGFNGYLWYGDKPAGDQNWADMGRTGASGVANRLSPYSEEIYLQRARAHATVIGTHPESFPDTHGSPILGMGYGALGAQTIPGSLRALLDANRWWFTLSQCADGSFYYQPNRDNAGYGADSRLSASAVTAFIFSIPKGNLAITGRSADHRR